MIQEKIARRISDKSKMIRIIKTCLQKIYLKKMMIHLENYQAGRKRKKENKLEVCRCSFQK
jgi:isocitrate dehydrogenase